MPLHPLSVARQPQASKRYLFQSLLLAEICACPTGRCLTTPREATLSILFVLLGYFGPGMIKTFITLRTGNAWVHAIGYHAIAPHVVVDTPLIAKVFGLR